VRRAGAAQAGILLAASGLTTLMTAVLGPNIPQMQKHFASLSGARYWVPLAVTTPLLVVAVASIFAGAAADRLGRKRLLLAGTWAYAAVGTAPLWLGSLYAIIASRALVGFADAAVMTCSLILIGDYWEGQSRQRVLALQTTVGAGSAVLFQMAGGFVGDAWGWRAPFALYALTLPLAVAMHYGLWEPRLQSDDRLAPRLDVVQKTFRPRLLAGICFLTVIGGLVFLVVPLHLGFLMQTLGIESPARIGIAQALNSAAVVAGTLTFGWMVGPRVRVAFQMALCVGVSGVGLVWLALAPSYAELVLAAMVEGVGCGLLLPMLVTWNMRELPAHRRGFGTGAFTSSLFLGMFANPLIVVYSADVFGDRASVFLAVGYALLVAAVIALVVGRTWDRKVVPGVN
jgi:MFS family permease